MSNFIRKIIPIVLFSWFFAMSVESNAQITDSSDVRGMDVFPNPFISTLTIRTNKIPTTIQEIVIYDALGNLVHIFDSADWQEESFVWGGGSNTGVTVSTGTYIVNIRTEDETESILIQKI